MNKRTLCALGVATALCLAAVKAHAVAISNTSLYVDWSTFVVTGGVENVNYQWQAFQYNGTHSEAQSDLAPPDFQTDGNNDWGTPVSVTSYNSGNTGSANADPTYLLSTAYAESTGTGPTDGWSNGNTHRGRYIELLTPTVLTFSVDYTVNQSYSRESVSLENAGGYSQFALGLSLRPGSPSLAGDIAAYSDSIGSGLAFSLTGSGTVSFDTAGLDSGLYWLEAHAHTSAYSSSTLISAVPEPLTIALLAIALAGLGLARREGAPRAS